MSACAGIGLKPEYYDQALAAPVDGIWFEVHAENYMVDGGPRLAWLGAIRERHPIALHGVAMSLAADADPDLDHLARLVAMAKRFEPARISEHLAWSDWGGVYYPDLLPVPRTSASLRRIAANICRVQDALKRHILIENPSHYLVMDDHEFEETDFLRELVRRSGCGLLLDINNVFVSARNLGFDAHAYLDAFPTDAVQEIHLAGHTADPALGESLLIDSHDAPVAEAVWALYRRFTTRAGSRPTLIERDGNLPDWEVLRAECDRAQVILDESMAMAA